jgi:hypothetical protein
MAVLTGPRQGFGGVVAWERPLPFIGATKPTVRPFLESREQTRAGWFRYYRVRFIDSQLTHLKLLSDSGNNIPMGICETEGIAVFFSSPFTSKQITLTEK